MKMGLWVTVFFGQSKINHIDLVAAFSNSHQKVVGFNVTMNKVFGMHIFNARYLQQQERISPTRLLGYG